MKLKIENKVVSEVEITLPYFCKTKYHYYKVFSESRCISVFPENNATISESHSSLAFNRSGITGDEQKQIPEAEFNKAFEKAVKILRSR